VKRDPERFGVELGRRLRRLRQAGGISQADLAEVARLHQSTIGRIERGRMISGRRTLIQILDALQIETDDLLDGIEWVPPGRLAPARGRWVFGPLPPIPASLSSGFSKQAP
jgi:transcriptional regulator with XRE-family HTH domain